MNLLLLQSNNMLDECSAVVEGRQLSHIHQTLNLKEQDTLTVGLVNQKIGTATLNSLTETRATLDITWHSEPPAALPVTLVIALPRPKMLKRIIQTISTMGVKEIYFINSWKVEKSYWQSPWLSEEKILENCILGLEQAKDSVLPKIHLRKLFKPFVEDELANISDESLRLLAHPVTEAPCPANLSEKTTLVIGPEGGFTPYEVGKIEEQGFSSVHLGPRILRVETAVPVLLSRLFPAG